MADRERESATLGGGCFWCLDAVFERLKGVDRVVCGYAGGHVPNPSYEEVCGKRTGHAEVVQVTFDPAAISFRDLLEVFFAIHDPTTPDRQGADVGPQYRSIILHHSPEQRETAEEVIRTLESGQTWGAPIVTEVVPLTDFYPAEEHHQDFFEKNPHQGYCSMVIAPKVVKLREKFKEKLKG